MNQTNPLKEEESDLTLDLHDSRNEQVSIIVVHRNRPEYLNICLQSIHVMSNLNNYEVIVVDNASQDEETGPYLDVIEQEGIKVIRNTENKYWSAACNQAVAAADPNSQYYVFLHCDTVVLDACWLDFLINMAESRDSGMIGCQLQSYKIQNQKADFIQEWCLLMSKDCWNDCGPWPEELPMVGMSFIMTLRAQYRGYKPQATGNAIVHHYRSFVMDLNEYDQISEKAMAEVPKLMQQAAAK